MDTRTRQGLLRAGWWLSSTGDVIRVTGMHDKHVVNALLKTLADAQPAWMVRQLVAEVTRRNLMSAVEAEIVKRERR